MEYSEPEEDGVDPIVAAYLRAWLSRAAMVRRALEDFDDDGKREWYKSLIPDASEFVESMTRDEMRVRANSVSGHV